MLENSEDSLLPLALLLEMNGYDALVSGETAEANRRLDPREDNGEAVALLITDQPAWRLELVVAWEKPVLAIVNGEKGSNRGRLEERGFCCLEKPVEPQAVLEHVRAELEGE